MVIKLFTAVLDIVLLTMLMSFVIDARDRKSVSLKRWFTYACVTWGLLICAIILRNDGIYILVMLAYSCVCIWSLTLEKRIKTVFTTLLLILIAGFPLNTLVFVLNVMGISLVDGQKDALLSACTAFADFLVIFWVYRQRKKYEDEMAIRFNIVEYGAAIFLFLLTTFLGLILNPITGDLNALVLETGSGDFLVTMLTLLVVFNNVFFLVMVWRSKTTDYYQRLNELNAQYVENELQYFESYKQAQEDIRAFRHDMKHHMNRLVQFCEENDTVALAAYLDHFQKEWDMVGDHLYQTGNDHIDAILNGRMAQFRKSRINVEVSGSFMEPLQLTPFDTCAIFANAVDNAIEENQRLEVDDERWIRLSIRKNQRYYVVSLENPLAHSKKLTGRTSKDDPRNHGFGLYSIREKTEKNGGSIQIERENGCFTLKIFLPYEPFTP